MKLSAFAATILAAGAVAGTAAAQMAPQATMQPIPNPPEKAVAKHGGKHKHHAMAHHAKAAKADKAADAAAAPQK